MVDRYRKNKAAYSVSPSLDKLSLEEQQALDDHLYPKNKEQERIVKLFSVIFDWFENFDFTKNWLNSIRNLKSFAAKSLIGDYHINTTSRKNPDFIIITNDEELIQTKEKSNYQVALSLKL